jgi:hypothetical protein
MSEQMKLFSGEELKKAGIQRVIENNADYVAEARLMARRVAEARGYVSSDDIQELFPPPPWAHHNVMGAVFADPMFKPVKFVRSSRPSAHGRMIRLYKVMEDGNA